MTTDLRRLTNTYKSLTQSVERGELTQQQSSQLLADHSVIDASGNTWWVDPRSSSPTQISFVVRTPDGAVFPGEPHQFVPAPPTPLPDTDANRQPVSFGPTDSGSTVQRGTLPTNYLAPSGGDDTPAGKPQLADLLKRFSGVSTGLKVATAGVFVAGALLVAFMIGGPTSTDVASSVDPGSEIATVACFASPENALDASSPPAGLSTSHGAAVDCTGPHTFETLKLSPVAAPTPNSFTLCDLRVDALSPITFEAKPAVRAGLWSAEDGGVVYCLVSFNDTDGQLVELFGPNF